MKKIGLIIQGPLVSTGKDGAKAHIPKTVLGEIGFVHYDCRENIQKIIDDFGGLFEAIVISTWDNEIRPGDVWSGATVVSLPDPGEVKRDEHSNRSRNKYRQFLGIRCGLIELEKNADIEYVVRIRTDQYLDLRELVDSFFARLEKAVSPEDIIGVPFTRPDDFFVHDIYLASRVQTLRKFCDAMLAFDMHEFIFCVHREMVLKHAYVNYRNIIAVRDRDYFPQWPPMGASTGTKRIFAFMFERVFVPLDPGVFRSVVWRGSPLSGEQIRDQQLDAVPSKKNMITIPVLVSTDWERYFSFLHDTVGRKMAFSDNVVTKTGKICWDVWFVLRNVAKKAKITDAIYRLVR